MAGFLLTYAAIAFVVAFPVAAALRVYLGRADAIDVTAALPFDLVLPVAAGIVAAMSLASLYRAALLTRGGGEVARLLGATEVAPDTTDARKRRLLNIVEEMAIASGLPVPEVYLLEREAGINAFAAGTSHTDAAITVTRGALELLDRAELQSIVAHEISHIVNGDVRLNQRLIALAFGVLVLSLVGRRLLRFGRLGGHGRATSAAAAVLAVGGGMWVVGAIGLLASRLLKAAVSRHREMLADASAVQFTRESSALAMALKKIAVHTPYLHATDSEEVSHMLFERGTRAFGGWFATHPPLFERIRVLEPGFDPRELAGLRAKMPAPITPPPDAGVQGGGRDVAAAAALRPGRLGTLDENSGDLLRSAGGMQSPTLAEALRGALPETLYRAAHGFESSWLLLLALALAPDGDTRAAQLGALEGQLGGARVSRIRNLRGHVDGLEPRLRIPLLELAVPALKRHPAAQLDFIMQSVERTVGLDTERRLEDYVLLRMVGAYLERPPVSAHDSHHGGARGGSGALTTLLAAVAAHGHDSQEAAAAALRAGLAAVGREPPPQLDMELATAREYSRLDASLARLQRLSPRGKRALLHAVLTTIRFDRRIEVEEIELFRAIAATLGCPVPPTADLGSTQTESARTS